MSYYFLPLQKNVDWNDVTKKKFSSICIPLSKALKNFLFSFLFFFSFLNTSVIIIEQNGLSFFTRCIVEYRFNKKSRGKKKKKEKM